MRQIIKNINEQIKKIEEDKTGSRKQIHILMLRKELDLLKKRR